LKGCARESRPALREHDPHALLHLAGVKAVDPDCERLGELWVTRDDFKRFRQLDTKCRGRWASGIETTTGPLGQGVATSVGMGTAVSRRRQT